MEAQYVYKDTQTFISFSHRGFVDHVAICLFYAKQNQRLEHDVYGSNARGSSVRAGDGADGVSIQRGESRRDEKYPLLLRMRKCWTHIQLRLLRFRRGREWQGRI